MWFLARRLVPLDVLKDKLDVYIAEGHIRVDGKDDYEMNDKAKERIKEMYQRKKMFEDAPSIPESTRMDLPEVPPRDFADLSKFEGEAPKSMADFEKRFTVTHDPEDDCDSCGCSPCTCPSARASSLTCGQ